MSYFTLYAALAVLFTQVTATGASGGCDKIRKCPCVESSLSPGTLNIDCSGMDLTIIPTNFPAKILSLDFSSNFAKPDRLHWLCRYQQLGTVSLARNHLSKLPGDQFGDCNVIDTLDLSGNEFHELNDSSLHGLHSLRSLIGIEARDFHSDTFTNLTSLRHLKIVLHQSSIPNNLFHGLQLESLDLIINGATELPIDLFESMSNTLNTLIITSDSLQWIDRNHLSKLVGLKKFSMSCKELRLIPETLFSETKNLKSVSLTLTSVPRNIFRNLKSLRSLKLYYLEDMPSELFEGLFDLNSLDVSKSLIPMIPDDWFKDLYKLEELILTDNGITELKDLDFTNLHSLKSLDISGNNIRELKNGVIVELAETVERVNISRNFLKRIYARNLAETDNLTNLDLSNNEIYKIETGTFRNMHRLRHLYLGNNKLSALPEESFAANTVLISLDLSSNVFSTIPEGLFKSTPNLESLDLSGNFLQSTGPSSMYPIQTLSHVDFSYNLITCDCDSYKLVLDMPGTTVLGNCEEPETDVPISEFKPEQVCFNIQTTSTDKVEITPTETYSDTTSSSSGVTDTSSVRSVTTVIDFNDDVKTSTTAKYHPLSIRISKNNPTTQTEIISDTTSSYSGVTDTSSVTSVTTVADFNNDVKTSTAAKYQPLPIRVSTHSSTTQTEIISDTTSYSGVTDTSIVPSVTTVATFKRGIETTTTAIHHPMSIRESIDKAVTPTKPLPTLELEKDAGTSKHNRVAKTVTDLKTYTSQTTKYVSLVSKNDRVENGTSVKEHGNQSDHEETAAALTTSIPHIHPNLTVDPGQIIVYQPVTKESRRIAIGSVVGVALVCILIIIGLLLYKRRRRSQYEVTDVRSATSNESADVSLTPLKDVPSIQIETVDASDNVKIEIYEPK